jgi:IS5 family transposase
MSKNKGQFSFFNLEERMDKIHKLASFLPKLNQLIDWEIFRYQLSKIRDKERLSNAGRKPYDVVLMFKMLILQTLYNLSDEQTEQQVCDRLSFMEFLGLTIADAVPDATTLWLFREDLKEFGLERPLFERFNKELEKQGFAAKGGYMVDGSFVEVPKQRNSKEENAQIKDGEIPETISSNPHVLAQKDTDADWTKKNDVSYFGYKNHPLADTKYKLIRDYAVTTASVHDSVPFLGLVPKKADKDGQPIYADSAYAGSETAEALVKRKFNPKICEKGYRNKPLTDKQRENNRKKSKIRCRVEHIFGEMKMRMGDEIMRTIGIARAQFVIGMRNLAYNMSRFVSLKCPKVAK